jgi:hypothetical protein
MHVSASVIVARSVLDNRVGHLCNCYVSVILLSLFVSLSYTCMLRCFKFKFASHCCSCNASIELTSLVVCMQ